MATLLRNTRSICTRFTFVWRNATAGTSAPAKPAASSTIFAHISRRGYASEMAVRNTRQQAVPVDAIRPKSAGPAPFIPLVGTSLNTLGVLCFGFFLSISAYFVYLNYITNPEFYKSLSLSREADRRDAAEKSSHH